MNLTNQPSNEDDELDVLLNNYRTHRIGSHSDDWGGDSDKPCFCDLRGKVLVLVQSHKERWQLEARIDELKNLPITRYEYVDSNYFDLGADKTDIDNQIAELTAQKEKLNG